MAVLAAGCPGSPGKRTADGSVPPSSSPLPSPTGRDTGEVNRDDVNGDGRADLVVNGWYKQPKIGGRWFNNRFVAFASPSGLDPAAAFRLSDRLVRPDPRIDFFPIFRDTSVQFTGDLDDDGHADIVVRTTRSDGTGAVTHDQLIVWGGPEGAVGSTELPSGTLGAAAVGDFDSDGALDLLTLGPPSPDHELSPQPATVLHGPLGRDGGTPRTTTTLDVGHGGWVPVAHALTGDFDGDGYDDLVTKAGYGEEDARLEEPDMPEVDHASLYRGTPEGLEEAGSVPGITDDSPWYGAVPVATGDFDGDGYDDILGRTEDEEVVVVPGSARGPGRGRAPVRLEGVRFGNPLTPVTGDVNGDGHDDVAVQTRGRERRVGEVTVLLGGPGGLSADRVVRIDRHAIGLGGRPRHSGDRDFFGWDLHLADLDADGRDELVVGTFGFNKPRKDAGYWLLSGTDSGPSTTDRRFVATKDFGGG